jgi:hypothetical protein
MTAVHQTARYGPVQVSAWNRLHQKLTSRAGWEGHDGELPVIEGTLIRLHATDHLPGYQRLEPMWLWSSRPDADPGEVTVTWQAYLRRFGAHLPPVQAGPGLDRPEDPRPGRRRPVDLAHHRLLHPALPGPAPRRRPAPALAAALPARPSHPRPGPPRIPEHPPGPPCTGQRTETRQTRPRPPARI